MAESYVRILGLRELEKAMREFPPRLQRQWIGRAVSAGASVIRKNVAGIARAEAFDSGALARNVRAKRGKRPRRSVVRYMIGVEHGKVRPITNGMVAGRRGKLRKASRREKAGEDPFYYGMVEVGHKDRAGGQVPGVRYMTRGFAQAGAGAVEALRQSLAKSIERGYPKTRKRPTR